MLHGISSSSSRIEKRTGQALPLGLNCCVVRLYASDVIMHHNVLILLVTDHHISTRGWCHGDDNVRSLLAGALVIDGVVADGGLFVRNKRPGCQRVVVTEDRVSGPILLVDVYVDAQTFSRSLVWLQTCGRQAHPTDRQLSVRRGDAGPSFIIHNDYMDLCKGYTTLIFTVCEYH